MTSRTQRRSISVRGDVYDRLKRWCDEHGESVASVVERAVTRGMDDHEIALDAARKPDGGAN